jgi:hypothetical protein
MQSKTVHGVAIVKRPQRCKVLPRNGAFCCLIGNSLKSAAEKETFVFVASDPVYATTLHNRCLTSIKETRSVAPFWHLVLAIGPFLTTETAMACGQRWVNCTRGCPSKMRKGAKLATEYGVPCYSSAVTLRGGTLRYLERNAPHEYVRGFRRLVAQTPPVTPIKTPRVVRNMWK